MYHLLLDTVSSQSFSLAYPREVSDPKDWEHRVRVLQVIESSIRQLWEMAKGGEKARKVALELRGRVGSWKYLRSMVSALIRAKSMQ